MQFKTIFWWEWTHRLARPADRRRVPAAVPLVSRGAAGWRRDLRPRLWFIFALGALQGAVGWWMVASGLADRVEVSQYRLATHLVLACAIYVALIWTARRLEERPALSLPAPRCAQPPPVCSFSCWLQIYLGALVAGLRAGYVYNTWPLIDGAFVPDAARLFFDTPLWRNFFENTLTVQFDHRMLAYGIWLLRARCTPSMSRARRRRAGARRRHRAVGGRHRCRRRSASGRCSAVCRFASRCSIRRWRCWS